MHKAKDIIVKPIKAKYANNFVIRNHYSKKIAAHKSKIHLGAFLDGALVGVAQFGDSLNKRTMAKNLKVGLNEFLELNRLVMLDAAPRNSESRFLSVCIKIIKKNYPFVRLILSFADACQCGDGTIYRASGFKLHSYKRNNSILKLTNFQKKELQKYRKNIGNIVTKKTLDKVTFNGGRYLSSYAMELGAKPLKGYQMKYLYCIDKNLDNKYNWVSFKDIPDEIKMYKGKRRIEHESNATNSQLVERGAVPTDALQLKEERDGKTK